LLTQLLLVLNSLLHIDIKLLLLSPPPLDTFEVELFSLCLDHCEVLEELLLEKVERNFGKYDLEHRHSLRPLDSLLAVLEFV